MNIDKTRYPLTVDGYDYRVLATDIAGDLPVAILVNGVIARLTADLQCPENEGFALAERRREFTRYFNVYRAADGSFCLGSKSFDSDAARRGTQDSNRAITGLRLTFNENSCEFTASAA